MRQLRGPSSRNGSQALADGIRLEFSTSKPVDCTPNPVVTALALAGFEVAFAFSLLERFSGLGLIVSVGFAASDPVVTSFSLAGFAGGRHLLFFGFVQHVAHIDEGYMPHAEINVPASFSLAGFG